MELSLHPLQRGVGLQAVRGIDFHGPTAHWAKRQRIYADRQTACPPFPHAWITVLRTMNLIFIFITAGGVCYWLARYISKPISKLGAAARQLADGDLKVRVGAVLGRRHDEISELGRDFDLMAERIESLISSQKRLLRDISHEFRSPLTRLTLALEIARRAERSGRDQRAGPNRTGSREA